MRSYAVLLSVVVVINLAPALGQTSEPGKFMNPNPDDVSPAWRKLADQYGAQVEALKAKRGDTKTQKERLKQNLDKIDVQEVFDKSTQEIEDSGKEIFHSAGKAGYEYFKDFGHLGSILDTANTIMGDMIPEYKKQIDTLDKPFEAMREQDRLERNISDLDDNMKKFDKDIDAAQRNMDLSNKIANFYEQNKTSDREKRQEIVFRLVDKSKVVNRSAVVAIHNYENTIPPGWVACSCPSVHRGYGRIVRGTLYHPNNVSCPQ